MRAYRFDSFEKGVEHMEQIGYNVDSRGFIYPAIAHDDYPRASDKALACAALFQDGSINFLNDSYPAVQRCHEQIERSLL